jgi:formylglycine-generating enzyme required for sulfatase activity
MENMSFRMEKIFLLLSFQCYLIGAFSQIPNSDMILIKAGSFTMGNSSFTRESPTRTINVSQFYMSRNVVTNAQFATFLNAYGSSIVKDGEFAGKPMLKVDSWGIINNNGTWQAATGYELFPMIEVTWYGANEFCKASGGRLPTEAEWEYAAKGGPTQQSYTFSGNSTASVVAWYCDNSGLINHPVGLKAANSLGLFDMNGNVYQWCSDWFGRYADFGTSGDLDPKGPAAGVSKVIRGGYRSIGSGDLHLTNRESLSPDESYNFVGFRLVKDLISAVVNPINDAKIVVFPNPARQYININSSANIESIKIFDGQGKLIKNIAGDSKNISLVDFSAGIYFMKILSDSKVTIQKFEVVN